jgi:hypothetical protein
VTIVRPLERIARSVMSLHPVIAQHTRRRRFSFAILRSLTLGAGLAATAGVAHAADPAPPAAASTNLSDVALARSALTALDTAAELKGVNLVVSVVNGVAVIGGPVPSAAVAKRAEQLVRSVEGIKDVRNACFVSNGPDPLLKAIADKNGTTLPQRPVMAELPGVLSNQLPAPVSPFPPNTNVAANDANSTVVARKPSLSGAAVVLGAPVGPAGSNVSAPSMPAPGTLTSSGANGVLVAAGDVRKGEARFANLTVELSGGVIMVGGSAPLASDAWDFAQKLRKIPGVSRVAVGAVAGK